MPSERFQENSDLQFQFQIWEMFDSHYELKNNFDNFKHPQFTHRNVIISLGTANSFTKFLIFCNFLSKLITFGVTNIFMQKKIHKITVFDRKIHQKQVA